MRPRSATSRLTVAWVARKPRSRSAAASSCWVRIARCSTRSRIARWRRCFITSTVVLLKVPATRAATGLAAQSQPGDDDDGRQQDAIDDEHVGGVSADVAEQDADGEEAGNERRDHADDEWRDLDRQPRLAGEELATLVDRRQGDDGGRHEEREAGRGFPVKPGEESGGDRDARARDPRHERDGLRGADRKRGRERELADRARLAAVALGEPEDRATHHEHERDEPDLADVLL